MLCRAKIASKFGTTIECTYTLPYTKNKQLKNKKIDTHP